MDGEEPLINQRHVMLDLETMGAGPRAAIMQIGACRFNPHSDALPSDHLEIFVNLESNITANMKVDGDTVAWWMRQSADARARLYNSIAEVPLLGALQQLEAWCKKMTIDGIWANGAAFDLAIVKSAYRAFRIDNPPWRYNVERDVRTMMWLSPVEKTSFGVKHRAVDDAIAQAQWIQRSMKQLRDALGRTDNEALINSKLAPVAKS